MYRNRSVYRKKAGYIVISILLSLILSSCIDNPPMHPEISDNKSYVELVWELYDQKYVSFDVKDVDWDAVLDEYIRLAEDVDSFDELKDLIIEMVGKLEDKNAFLEYSYFGAETVYFPTYSPEIEINYDYSVLMELLEPWEFQWHDANWGYCVIDTIPYFAIGQFDFFFTFMHFSDEVKKYLDAPGMIIDTRMSDGISLVPAEQIPGIFADQYGIVFYTQHRTGPEHNDLSPLSIHEVSPRSWAYTKPIILLIGEQNIGPAEAFASLMGQFSHVIIIGDTTGGGGNTPGYFNQRYWPLWENFNITCPFARVFTADTVLIEGNGILPDIYVQTTPSDFLAGHDPVLEYAIEWIAEETAR